MSNARIWQKKIKSFFIQMIYGLYPPGVKRILKLAAALGLAAWSLHAFAQQAGGDLLAGTDTSAKATLTGTGKVYLYLGEGVVALITYIKSRNPMVLTGIIVCAIFLNIIIH